MMILLISALTVAGWLVARPPGGRSGRIRKALSGVDPDSSGMGRSSRGRGWRGAGIRLANGRALPRQRSAEVPMTVVVQQLAALLKGGRTPARLWDELWLVYTEEAGGAPTQGGPPRRQPDRRLPDPL